MSWNLSLHLPMEIVALNKELQQCQPLVWEWFPSVTFRNKTSINNEHVNGNFKALTYLGHQDDAELTFAGAENHNR